MFHGARVLDVSYMVDKRSQRAQSLIVSHDHLNCVGVGILMCKSCQAFATDVIKSE